MSVEIWHNPRCSKSRQTLALLEQHKISAEVMLYLQSPPSLARLEHVQHLLNQPVLAMIRHKDPLFKTLGLSKNSPDDALFAALGNYPALIERPVVITDTTAAIGRPPEAILSLFTDLPHRD